MKKSGGCNPNFGCRDMQLKNTVEGFNQLISTYNRLSVCSTKSDGDQLWKELTSGITIFRRTLSKLESRAFDLLSRRFETISVPKEDSSSNKTAPSTSMPNNSTPFNISAFESPQAATNDKSTADLSPFQSQPKYNVVRDKDGSIVVQQLSPVPVPASPAAPLEPVQARPPLFGSKHRVKLDGWGDPIQDGTDSEKSSSPTLKKAEIVDFPEPLKTSMISAPRPNPVDDDDLLNDFNYCAEALLELAPRLPLSVPFRAGEMFNARLLCVVSPLEFYVIKESHLRRLSEVEAILDSVARHLLTQPLTPELCVVGGACLVLTGEHISRASIKITGTDELQVFLVDYGRARFVKTSTCYAMPKCVANMAPPLAHNCSVLGADSRRLDHAALTAFNDAVVGKDEIQLRATGTSRATHGELVEIVGGARIAALPTTRPTKSSQLSAGDTSSPFRKVPCNQVNAFDESEVDIDDFSSRMVLSRLE